MTQSVESLRQAQAFCRDGRLDDAEHLGRQILATDPEDADTLDLLGAVAYRRGQAAAALEWFARAAALAGERAEFHLHLAMANMALGRTPATIECLSNALRLEPNNAKAQNDLGVLLANAGRLRESADCFREIVRIEPRSEAAHNRLGMILLQLGDADQAIEWLEKALAIAPQSPAAHLNLGNAHQASGNLPAAIDQYRRALALDSNFYQAHVNLALALGESGQLDKAISCCREVLRMRPDFVEARLHLGQLCHKRGLLDEAREALEVAVRQLPESAEAHYHLAGALFSQRQFQRARAHIERALKLKPGMADAHYLLANIFREQGEHEQAIAGYREALRYDPRSKEAFNNLAVTLRDAKQFDEAIDCFRHALEIDPECGEAYSSLGMTFQEQGDLAEALVCYDEALRLGNVQPAGSPSAASVTTWPSQYDLAAVHRNRAFANLLLGNYASGLDEYEWRWHTEGASKRLPLAEWDGAPLEGRPILLSHEQGLGDMIQFIRYAPLVQQRGGTVVVGCPQSLMPLLKTCPGVDRLIYQHELASGIEVQAALMSLPRIFRTGLDSIPAGIPYLFADQQLTEHWRGVLSPRGGLRVGIAWQGNPDYKGDRYRSIPLACFAPLATVCGVRLISLQKGHGQEQLAAATFEIEDLGSQLDNEGHAFFDTAAVMQNLDLVITSDTAIAHLAGALGARVWLALPRVPDWRWHMDRDDSPWYPTMRLFRQSRWGDWTDVFEAIRNELGRLR